MIGVIRRDLLWAKLEAQRLDGAWLAAVRALYAEVPMAIRTDEDLLDCFLVILGLEQGCPLSPTLFGLYNDDFEDFLMAAVRSGEQLDLPFSGTLLVVVLLYADNMALVATSTAGLHAMQCAARCSGTLL